MGLGIPEIKKKSNLLLSNLSLMIEIERKFLVKSDAFKKEATASFELTQAYLSSVPERTVRVRIRDDKAFLTIKGKSSADGTSRFEWEKEIEVNEAKELILLAEPHPIKKTRYIIPIGKHLFEVDVFHGIHKGLVIAEIELSEANEEFHQPDWLGEEVTGQKEYYNSYLKNKAFSG